MATVAKHYIQALAANGTTVGVAQVADTSGYWPGAFAWIKGPNLAIDDGRRVVIKEILSATTVRVTFADKIDDLTWNNSQGHPSNNAGSDISGFLTGGTLTQPEQAVHGVRNDLSKP